MPFTLAHPSIVLPLKRIKPQWFDLDALVIGSMVPDAGYALQHWNLETLSHSARGIFLFSMPVGMALLVVFRVSRSGIVQQLPARQRTLFKPLISKKKWDFGAIVFSLLVGVLSHLAWDSFTHSKGFLVRSWAPLRMVFVRYQFHELKLCHILWYLSSFAGVGALSYEYQHWVSRYENKGQGFDKRRAFWTSLTFSCILMPLLLIHHLRMGIVGDMVAVAGSMALIAVAVFAHTTGHSK